MPKTADYLNLEQHLSAIIASSDDAIVSKTLDGTITSWNPGAERMLGYSASEAIGQNIRMIIPQELWPEEDDVLRRIGRGERVDHFETTRRTKDGRLVNISLTVSPIKNSTGTIIGASKVARDVTEHKNTEKERERLLKAEKEARQLAEQANRFKDEFLAVVSHELRSPLNSIVGWASLLLEGNLAKERVHHAIETILRNAEAQNQLIGDLLDVARIISGKMRLDIKSIDVNSAVTSAIEVLQPAARAKNIQIENEAHTSVSTIPADPDRIQQILWNLLSNAVKFTPVGGRIVIRSSQQDSIVKISVTDNGMGIAPELLPVIFERFRQGDMGSTRNYGGLGLGLAIVRHLVELHGGVIRASSGGPGRGAEFVVELPADSRIPLQNILESSPVPTVFSSEGPSLTGIKILLVDDESDAREMVTEMLERAGAQVTSTASVQAAMQSLAADRPDVLISDIAMPGEDGFDLIKRVRQIPTDQSKPMPAIALTAFARTQDRLRILNAGFQMHVPKPVQPVELRTVVASVTRNSIQDFPPRQV